MFDAVSKAITQADARGEFLDTGTLDSLKQFIAEGEKRKRIVDYITVNKELILSNTRQALFTEQPHLIQPGGSAYSTPRMTNCIRDLDIILRYIVYAIFVGDASVLDDHCLNGLKETYASLGVPSSSVIVAIEKMKDSTLNLFSGQRIQQKDRELTITDIQRLYPKQWIIIEVSQFKNGFPSGGKILFYDNDLDNLADKASHLSGNIYTFFTGMINEEPTPLDKEYNENEISFLTSEYSDLLQELSTYFERVISALC